MERDRDFLCYLLRTIKIKLERQFWDNSLHCGRSSLSSLFLCKLFWKREITLGNIMEKFQKYKQYYDETIANNVGVKNSQKTVESVTPHSKGM